MIYKAKDIKGKLYRINIDFVVALSQDKDQESYWYFYLIGVPDSFMSDPFDDADDYNHALFFGVGKM